MELFGGEEIPGTKEFTVHSSHPQGIAVNRIFTLVPDPPELARLPHKHRAPSQ